MITTLHAKIAGHFLQGKEKEEVVTWIKEGAWVGDGITKFGGKNKEELRKTYFNFVKGAEVAVPFSVYNLWHKKENNRLDLQDADSQLRHLEHIKPSDAELREQNDVMRKELAFAATQGATPAAVIDATSAEHQGRVQELQKERA